VNREANVAFNFNCLVETEGPLTVAGSHVRYIVIISRKRYKIKKFSLQTMN